MTLNKNSYLIKVNSLGPALVYPVDDITTHLWISPKHSGSWVILNKNSYSIWLVLKLNNFLEWYVDYEVITHTAAPEEFITNQGHRVLIREAAVKAVKEWDCQVRGVAY